MVRKYKWKSRLVVLLLVLVLIAGGLSGAVAGEDITAGTAENQETKLPGAGNETAYSATSTGTKDGTVSPTESDEEGYERVVAVTVLPNGNSFQSDETMDILVGALNYSDFEQSISGATLDVTVQRPDGTTWERQVTTGSQGNAQVDYDLSNDNQDGTYEVTVSDTSSDASATVSPDVGPAIITAERDFQEIVTGKSHELNFLVRNGQNSVAGEEVNITVEGPDNTVIDSQLVETGSDGFASITVNPSETGNYNVRAEVLSTGSTAEHGFEAGSAILTSDYDFGQAVAGEPFTYGGFLEGPDGLLRDEPIQVAISNSTTEVVNISTTTDNSGFLLIESQIDYPDYYEVDVTTDSGSTYTSEDNIDVIDPYKDESDSSVELDITSRRDRVPPGSDATFDIQATDDGSPIANEQIQVFARVNYNGAPLYTETVTTDESGSAVIEVPTPSDMDGVQIDGTARLRHDGSTIDESFDADAQQYSIDTNFWSDADVGSTATFDISVEATDGSGSVANIPVHYNALRGEHSLDSYATGELVTDESGQAEESVAIPRDLRPSRAVVPFSRYENREDGSLYYIRMFDFPGTADISGASGETDFGRPVVKPGDQITVDFTTGNGTAASGFAIANIEVNNTQEYAEVAVGDDISTDSTATLTIPEYAAEDSYQELRIWTADSQGRFYASEVPFEIDTDPPNEGGGGGGGDDGDDDNGDISASLTASPTDVEAGTNVTFTAETTDFTATEYRWDFDGDGNTERTTTTPQIEYEYTVPGTYAATVTAVDDSDTTAEATTDIEVADTTNPTAVLELPSETVVDEPVTLDASGSTDNSEIDSYTWTIENESGVVAETTSENPTVISTPNTTGEYTVSLTITDIAGNTNTTSKTIDVISSANLQTTVTADDPQRFNEPVNATITVNNTGDQNTTEAFTVRYTATGLTDASDSSSIERNFTIDQNISADGSVSKSVNLTDWVTENNITGEVTVDAVANVNDNVSDVRPLDDRDTTQFAITYANLTVTTGVSDATTAATETNINAYVRNTGTANSTETDVTVTVTNSTGDVIVDNTSSVEELSTDARNRTRLTRMLGAGTYTISASVDNPDFPGGNSATETFSIAEYNLNTSGSRGVSELETGQNATVAFFYRTNDTAVINASLDLNGSGLQLQPNENASKKIRPPSDQRNFVTYDLQATNTPETTELEFNVSDPDDTVTDSTSESIDVSVLTQTVSNSTNIIVNSSSSDATSLTVYDEGQTETHHLNVSVQGGTDGRTLQGLEYLVDYPYGCVEQTTSAFLGALNTDQYYRDRPDGSVDDTQQSEINGSIETGIKRLNETGTRGQQNTSTSIDGSWNMWGTDGVSGDTYYSVYALFGTSSVANDEIYGPKNEESLDGIDFNDAVDWLDKDQNADGSFDANSYINDRSGMTGFTMVALEESNDTTRVSTNTHEEIASIYASSAEYLVNEQEDDGRWDEGDNPDKSTALAVHGLQIALDADAHEQSDTLTETEIKSAIDSGTTWLVENQNEDGSWDVYHDSGFWNYEGDRSLTTAYTVTALNETGMAADNTTITAGTDYLIGVYQDDGSWGYPRATAMSIDALNKLTSGAADGTLDITLDGSSTVEKEVTVNNNNPQETISLTEDELENLRGDGEGTTTVEIDVTSSDSGEIIVGVENTQEIIAATGGN